MTGWHEQQISSSTESILTHSTQANQEKIKLDHLCLGFVFNLHTKSSFQSTFVPAQKKKPGSGTIWYLPFTVKSQQRNLAEHGMWMNATTLLFWYCHGNSYKSSLKHLNLTLFLIKRNWMIVMMHFGSWANCSITTGDEPFPSLFSRLCFWSKHSDQDSNLELSLKKKKSPSSSGSTHGLKLFVLSKVSIWMLKMCTVSRVEKSRLLKSLTGFFSKGFHFPGKAGGKKRKKNQKNNTFWRVDWSVGDLHDVICSRKEKENGILIQCLSVCNQYTLF